MWHLLLSILACGPDASEDAAGTTPRDSATDVDTGPADSGGDSGRDSAEDSGADSAEDDTGGPDSGNDDTGADSASGDSGDSAGSDSADGPSDSGAADTALEPAVAFAGSVEVEAVAAYETHGGVADGRIGSIDNLSVADDLTGDGAADVVLGSPFHAPGSAFVLGSAADWTGSVESDALAVVEGESELGFVPLTMGDATGDGAADLVVGDRSVDGSGAAYVFAGPLSGSYDVTDAWMTVEGGWSGAQWAEALDVGDVDGDGISDLVVGGTAPDGGAGAVSVFAVAAGRFAGTDGVVAYGDAAGDGLGATVVVGDLDADGYEDAFLGVPGRDDAATDAGAVVVLAGSASGVGGVTWTFLGPVSASARAGTNSRGVAPPADLDGSGAPDVALAAYAAGQVAVFLDPAPGLHAWSDAASALVEPGTGAGASLAVADLDDDGDDDLLVGCYNDGTYASSGGSALFFADLPSGTFDRASATAELWTPDRDQYLGTAVAGRPGEWFTVASWRAERASRGGALYAVAPW